MVRNATSLLKKVGSEIWTDPFLSFPSGYKLQVKWTVKKDNLGYDLYVLRGENDDQVCWPVRGNITVTLYDQTTRKVSLKSFRTKSASSPTAADV